MNKKERVRKKEAGRKKEKQRNQAVRSRAETNGVPQEDDLVWILPEEIEAEGKRPAEQPEKSGTENAGGRAARKGQLLRMAGEALYNCPYLLALCLTCVVALTGFDEIGVRAAAADVGEALRQAAGGKAAASIAVIGGPSESAEADDARETDGAGNAETVGAEGETPADRAEKSEEDAQQKLENAGECKEEKFDKENEIEQENNNNIAENIENKGNAENGTTKFEFYTPIETDSPYYSDAGKIALTTEYPYAKENESYFNDAAFLGDSRTLGISDYAGLDGADFYCDSGMMIFKLLEADGVTYQRTGQKVDLSQVLQEKHYGKIYIMLGMNELGYGNTAMYLDKYREVVDRVREWQPGAVIYIMANLHVSEAKNNMETEFNNVNINDKNAAAASLANGKDIFYLDANPLFTDENGFLNADLTFDGVHLYAQHYDAWREFLMEHAVETGAGQTKGKDGGRDETE